MEQKGETMASYLWRKYADYVYTKWERTLLWDMIEPYRRPKSFTPLVLTYVSAFYTGVIGAAMTEQLYKVPLQILGFCILFFETPLLSLNLGTQSSKLRLNLCGVEKFG